MKTLIIIFIIAIIATVLLAVTQLNYPDKCREAGGVPVYIGNGVNCAKEGYIDLYK